MEKKFPVEAPLVAWGAPVLELVPLLVSNSPIVLVLEPELDPVLELVLLAVLDPRVVIAISELTASTSVSIAEPVLPPEVPEASLQ